MDLTPLKGLERKGSIEDMLAAMARHEDLHLGDELYVCLSRRERDTIKKLSRYCDYKVVRFYYVPMSVESIGLNLKRELLDDIEIYTTYENPLQNVGNRILKRTFDIVFSLVFLIPTALGLIWSAGNMLRSSAVFASSSLPLPVKTQIRLLSST